MVSKPSRINDNGLHILLGPAHTLTIIRYTVRPSNRLRRCNGSPSITIPLSCAVVDCPEEIRTGFRETDGGALGIDIL